MTAQAVLEATSIGLRYPGESRAGLETFDFTLEAGETVSILGQAASANRACCACWVDCSSRRMERCGAGTTRRHMASAGASPSRFRIRAFSLGFLWIRMLPSDLIFKHHRYFMTSKLDHACSGSR